MLTAEEIADVPIATPAGQGVTIYDILYCAADAFATGERRWHRAGDPHVDKADCLMLSITRAARKLGCYYRAYDAVAAVQRYLAAPLGDWNDAAGRTQQEVVDALRGAAVLYG